MTKKSNTFLLCILLFLTGTLYSQDEVTEKKEKYPSYFGLVVKPVFPTRFIGSPETVLIQKEFKSTLTQKMGYSFGATVRAGLTKLLAFETGINFTQRNFDVAMSVADSNISATNDLSFICYDIPLNGLVYVQLSKQFYMNASLGVALVYKPTDVGIINYPGGYHSFSHTGRLNSKASIDLNANFGFEYRTEKIGFFYIGGSGRVPLSPIFNLIAQYKYQGYTNTIYGEVDGSYLSLDFKYFFPNIKNKGVQFQRGPIL